MSVTEVYYAPIKMKLPIKFTSQVFWDEDLSYNYRMTEFTGALGQCGLTKLDKHNEIRIENALYLSGKLQSITKVRVRLPRSFEKGVYYGVLLDVLDTWVDFEDNNKATKYGYSFT